MTIKNMVVKQSNALITASYKLTLAEKRLICLGIASSNGSKEALKQCEIHAKEYADRFDVSISAAYKALHEASLQLFERKWSYTEKGSKGTIKKLRRWIQGVDYGQADGVIRLIFSEDVMPVLIDLKRTFTYYDLTEVASLTSTYAIRIYELVVQWRSVGRTPELKIEDFRRQIGVDSNEYTRMTDFKRRVLDLAVNQINEHTDIDITYEQHKRGRKIVSFSFILNEKESVFRDPSTIDFINGKSDNEKSERLIISKRQAEEMARPGETYKDLYQRLSRDYRIK